MREGKCGAVVRWCGGAVGVAGVKQLDMAGRFGLVAASFLAKTR